MKFIKGHKLISVLLSLLFAAIIILALTFSIGSSGSGVFNRLYMAIEKPMTSLGSTLRDNLGGAFSYRQLMKENEKLKEENPHYSEQGRLDITDSEEIAELIGACQESSLAENNGLCSSFNGDEDLFVYVTMKNGSQIRSNLDLEKLTSRGKELFTGIPVAF